MHGQMSINVPVVVPYNQCTLNEQMKYAAHVEVYVGVEDLGDDHHRRGHHGVMLPHVNLELVDA